MIDVIAKQEMTKIPPNYRRSEIAAAMPWQIHCKLCVERSSLLVGSAGLLQKEQFVPMIMPGSCRNCKDVNSQDVSQQAYRLVSHVDHAHLMFSLPLSPNARRGILWMSCFPSASISAAWDDPVNKLRCCCMLLPLLFDIGCQPVFNFPIIRATTCSPSSLAVSRHLPGHDTAWPSAANLPR